MYQIERNFITGQIVDNIIYDETSFNMAMQKFINNGGVVLKPFSFDKKDEVLGVISDFDNEYVYLSEIFDESFEDELYKYKCVFYIVTDNDQENVFGIEINKRTINEILKIRIACNEEEL